MAPAPSSAPPSPAASSSAANNIGSLYGKYIFADFNSGNIWSLERTTTHGSPIVERIAGQSYIAGFGTDPSNGDLLMADLIGGQIRRLVPGTPDPTFPDTLSKTGIFSSVATLTPNAGVIPYDANLPFWSDYAIKQRWFVIKNTSDLIGYSEDDPWTFPEGMVWVKHFDLELTRGDPATKRRIETRVLVKTATASYGVSYRWNNIASGIQTEATLVADGGEDIPLTIDTGSSTVPQTWSIPSHAQCIICHTPEAGHALSFNTRQLNHSGTLGGGSDNFLTLLNDCGYLDALPSDPAALPRHISPTESTLLPRSPRPLLSRRQLRLLPPIRRHCSGFLARQPPPHPRRNRPHQRPHRRSPRFR